MSTYTASRKDGERLLETISKGWNSTQHDVWVYAQALRHPKYSAYIRHYFGRRALFLMLFLFLSQESRPLSNLGGRYVVSLSPSSGTFLLVLV